MTLELPDDLRPLDDQLKAALSAFAPPADLDSNIVSHVSRRSRLRLVMPTSRMAKAAAAVMAASLLFAVGYVADRQINGAGSSNFFGDIERLVAFDSRRSRDALPSEYYLQDDIEYFPAGPEFKLSKEAAIQESSSSQTIGLDHSGNPADIGGQGPQNFFSIPFRQNSFGSASNRLDGKITYADATKSGGGSLVVTDTPEFQFEGSRSQTAGIMTGAGVNSNAGLVGNIVIDEQNVDVGALHFTPGQRVGSGKAQPTTNAPAVTLFNGQSRFDGSTAADQELSEQENGTTIQLPEFLFGGATSDTPVPDGGTKLLEGIKDLRDDQRIAATPRIIIQEEEEAGLLGLANIDSERNDEKSAAAAGGQGVPAPAPAEKPATPASQAVAVRQKVIRNGTVEFEVDSFDTALMTISKLVVENGGFVASTDSSKLPNGKTRGAVTLRLPPERLDTFVLMLRGLGDLKSQKIVAQDVSKQYTDIESQLRASRAMEERLLDMIKTGKGSIKDLLAAEKELGVWREKIEKLEGEIRYYDNLIGLSTLTVVLQERDIKASAASIEVETISAGVETDNVEKARDEIIKAIDEAKGRIITSDLKKLDAGQFSATIHAEVARDRSGAVVDRLKQLGKVARLDIDRKQTTVEGTAPPLAGAPVEQKPTRLTISLYNLANVAPRLTTSATLASDDVEAAYQKIMALVEEAGGRIVTSQLQRPQPDQVQANLQIEVPSAQAAAAQAAMTALGEVMSLQLSENPDTANVTTAKQGFAVRIISAAGVAARETVTLQLASLDVAKAHRALADAAASLKARVVQSNVTEGDGDNVSAVLQLDLPRMALAEWDQARQDAGEVLTRSVMRSTDQQNTLDRKLRINLTFFPADRLPPRQVTAATVRVRSSESQQQAFLAQAQSFGGRIIDQTMSRDSSGRGSARAVLDVPRDKAAGMLDDLRSAGEISSMNTSTNPQAPEGPLARTRFDVQFIEHASLVGAETGFLSSIKAGLATSLAGLGYSLRLLVIAVCLVAPWAAVLWAAWRLTRRSQKKRALDAHAG